jgi:hypothetical protein
MAKRSIMLRSHRFAALEDLDAEVEINNAWEMITENIKILAKEGLGYHEKKHNPWFDEGCSKLLGQRKQAKLQCPQEPSEINGNNLNHVRHETSEHFRNKKGQYLKEKINELAMNSKNLDIQKYIQLNHWYLIPVVLGLKLLLQSINHQAGGETLLCSKTR